MSAIDLSVVIPAYNEEARLRPTLETVVDYLTARGGSFEVIVVDDGSMDGTSEVVHRFATEATPVRLIRLAANQGKGYAVRSGVLNARGGIVLFSDADGATPIAEVERLEGALRAGADVAIGSRALRSDGVRVAAKLHRRLIGRLFHLLVRTLTVKGIMDTQCGFKLFRAPVAQDLFTRMRMNGYAFDVELLMMAFRGGYAVTEVPVNWQHQPGSKVNLVTDSLAMARDLVAIRARAWRGDYDEPHMARLYVTQPPQVGDGEARSP